jgi:hypothetical protein
LYLLINKSKHNSNCEYERDIENELTIILNNYRHFLVITNSSLQT